MKNELMKLTPKLSDPFTYGPNGTGSGGLMFYTMF